MQVEVQLEVDPVVAIYVPAAQLEQVEEPGVVEYLPAAHEVQTEAPVEALY